MVPIETLRGKSRVSVKKVCILYGGGGGVRFNSEVVHLRIFDNRQGVSSKSFVYITEPTEIRE